jgi:precorrin-3B methylase
VVVATDVAREGERLEHTTLATLDPASVTMRSLVLVAGESATWTGPWLVALRDAANLKGPGPFVFGGGAE